MAILSLLFAVVVCIGAYGFATSVVIRRDPTGRSQRVMGALGGLIAAWLWLVFAMIGNFLMCTTGLIRLLQLERYTPTPTDVVGRLVAGIRGVVVTPIYSAVIVIASFLAACAFVSSARAAFRVIRTREQGWGWTFAARMLVVLVALPVMYFDVYLLAFRLTTMIYPDLIQTGAGKLPSLGRLIAERRHEFGASTVLFFGAAYLALIILSELALASAKARWSRALSEAEVARQTPAFAPPEALVAIAQPEVAPMNGAPQPPPADVQPAVRDNGIVRRIPRIPGGRN